MKLFQMLTVSVLVCLLFSSGCIDRPGDIVDMATEAADSPVEMVGSEDAATMPTPEQTFAKLQTAFPTVFDAEFKTLRKTVNSKTYLDFLRRENSIDKTVQDFDELLEVVPPPTERYLPFLEEHFKNPGDIDVVGMHRMTIYTRNMLARLCETPQDIFLIMNDFAQASGNDEHIDKWMSFRFGNQEPDVVELFSFAVADFVKKVESEDQARIREHFEQYGRDAGLLWLALREPVLIGHILNDFPNTDIFLRWVDGKCNQLDVH